MRQLVDAAIDMENKGIFHGGDGDDGGGGGVVSPTAAALHDTRVISGCMDLFWRSLELDDPAGRNHPRLN